jgi:hypothetical protein
MNSILFSTALVVAALAAIVTLAASPGLGRQRCPMSL